MDQKPKVVYRISNIEAIFFYAFTVPADFLQLVLKLLWLTGIFAILSEAIGWALSGAVFFIVGIGMAGSGVNFLSGRRTGRKVFRFIVSFVIEFLPFINLIPSLTFWTFLTIRESRAEDRERAAESAKLEEGKRKLHQNRMRLRRERASSGTTAQGIRRGGLRGTAVRVAGATPLGRAALIAGTVAQQSGMLDGSGGAKGGIRGRATRGAMGATPMGRVATVGTAVRQKKMAANDNLAKATATSTSRPIRRPQVSNDNDPQDSIAA